ncbi:hypothetical protein TGAM01_v202168 [Trichoderma gamsii]|uniref:Uncharacterized protein n=1 Tax=Trichoderma gamsii TaxID=398673 RepID=A0A2P4ZXP4_9HYPO|nr:hypothetical protein TGAM01_v202168 [Trichoderma gamsii]PON29060.1 hypothetical protein TGAM01_v202168 [Trichoderma gamsii]
MSQDTLDKTLILRDDLDEKIDVVKKEMDDAQRLAKIAQKNQDLREKARHYRNQLVLTILEMWMTAGGLLRPRPEATSGFKELGERESWNNGMPI